jgi:CMP-N,N'-diacetyllegionaminic acid synthase
MNIAFIPARIGSKRLPRKNIKLLNGIPLIAYAIYSSNMSGEFSQVIVSTDSEEVAEIAIKWGASVNQLRPSELATDKSADNEWLQHELKILSNEILSETDLIGILRPTNPLRSSNTIRSAVELLTNTPKADSIRAMQITDKHPGKMWRVNEDGLAHPYLDQSMEIIPTHNRSTQSLETLWVQNASLEIVRKRSFLDTGSISGNSVLGFEMPNYEGFDINTQEDWSYLEYLIHKHPNLLPKIEIGERE